MQASPVPQQVSHPDGNMEHALDKSQKFYGLFLQMSGRASVTFYEAARKLVQSLVNAEINVDIFAERLKDELNSVPQPTLVPLLKSCLLEFRNRLAKGAVILEGIESPPRNVLIFRDPDMTVVNYRTLRHKKSSEPLPDRRPLPEPKAGKIKGVAHANVRTDCIGLNQQIE